MPLSYNQTQRDIGLKALYCQDFDDDSTYFFFLALSQDVLLLNDNLMRPRSKSNQDPTEPGA